MENGASVMKKRTRFCAGASLCLALLFLAMACNRKDLAMFRPSTYFPDESKGEIIQWLSNTSPENVFQNLMLSYNHRNFLKYDSLIAPDYRFYMSDAYEGYFNRLNISPDPADWIEDPANPALGITRHFYKNRDQDLESVRKMFDPAGQAKDIELFFQASPFKVSADSDTTVFHVTGIELTVMLRSGVVYRATDITTQEARFSEVTLLRGADHLWRILRWKDGTNGGDDQ
jgi:hypothetical protein